jgi:hypothetical protein
MSRPDARATAADPITLPADLVESWLELAGLSAPPRSQKHDCQEHAISPDPECIDCLPKHECIDCRRAPDFHRRVDALERHLHDIVNSTRALGADWRFVSDKPIRDIETALAAVNEDAAVLSGMFNGSTLTRPAPYDPAFVEAYEQLRRSELALHRAVQPTKQPRRKKGGQRGRPRGGMGIDGIDAGERCFRFLYHYARKFGGAPGLAAMTKFLELLKPHLPPGIRFPDPHKLDRLMRYRRDFNEWAATMAEKA